MRLLWQRGAVPVKDIGAALQLDYGTLSPLLKRLKAAGRVRRARRPDDERSVEIALVITSVNDGASRHLPAPPSSEAPRAGERRAGR